MTPNPRSLAPIHLQNQLILMREEQIRNQTIIAQVINTRRLQRQYAATHNHLDLAAMRRAEDVLDDLLESVTAIWPDPAPMNLISGFGPEGGDA